VTEHDIPDPVQRQHDGVRKRIEGPDVFGCQTLGRPDVDRRRPVRRIAIPRNAHEVSVRVAANQEGAIAEGTEAVQHFARLGSGGDVARDDDEIGSSDVGLGQHRLQGR
jgi:hypothetical protein